MDEEFTANTSSELNSETVPPKVDNKKESLPDRSTIFSNTSIYRYIN